MMRQLFLVVITLVFQISISLRSYVQRSLVPSKTTLYYTFFPFKKTDDEKKDPKRLIKNILFPGIYRDYEDTAEVKKTIKIDTRKDIIVKSRNTDIASFQSQESKSGSYNSVDASSAPQVIDTNAIKRANLKPIARPADFTPTASGPKKVGIPSLGGVSVLPNVNSYLRTTKPIILYEYEASADCKRVREACSILDLNVEFRPCPGGTNGFSDQQATITIGGKREVPFMIDLNPKMIRQQLLGANVIVNYLFDTYGGGVKNIPGNLKGSPFTLPSLGSKGMKLRANARPDFVKIKPLTLYGYEGIGGVKQVREVLTELGLSHVLINCANGSANRQKLIAKKGFFDVPFLIDPNTGLELFNAGDIVRYLEKTYTV